MDWQLPKEDKTILKVSNLNIVQLCDFRENMRDEDRLEWYYASGTSFGLTEVQELFNALCLYDDETHKVYAIGGLEDSSLIWVVCTKEVDVHPIKFLRFCKPFFKQWMETRSAVYNYVWLRNERHVQWLKWLGAEFGEYKYINGEPFQKFTLYKVKE